MDKQTIANDIVNEIRNRMTLTKVSQNQIAAKLGIAAASLSNLMTNKLDTWSEESLRELYAKLNIGMQSTWEIVSTEQFAIIQKSCAEARNNSRCIAVVASTGQGKTTALIYEAKSNANTYYVLCNVDMNPMSFYKSIAKAIGISISGSKQELLAAICQKIKSANKPLLILDDFGKVSDSVYQRFQLIYDECEGSLGIIIAGVERMQKDIIRKKEADKLCFPELYRRIAYWKVISGISGRTIVQIAKMHNIENEDIVKFLKKYAENIGNLKEWITNAKRIAAGEEITLEIITKSSNINQ